MSEIRRMTPHDIPAGMRLKAAAEWNQTEADWRLFLDLNPDGCYVALHGSEVVGTVTTIDYGDLAWIAMLLVDPAHRKQDRPYTYQSHTYLWPSP